MIQIAHKLNYLLILFFLLACSSIRYQSNSKANLTFSYNQEHKKEVLVRGKKKFYLWGLVPDQHIVFLDEVILSANLKDVSSVVIYEDRSFLDSLLMVASFGMYIPVRYNISALTK
jgi:hypothetical protein